MRSALRNYYIKNINLIRLSSLWINLNTKGQRRNTRILLFGKFFYSISRTAKINMPQALWLLTDISQRKTRSSETWRCTKMPKLMFKIPSSSIAGVILWFLKEQNST